MLGREMAAVAGQPQRNRRGVTVAMKGEGSGRQAIAVHTSNSDREVHLLSEDVDAWVFLGLDEGGILRTNTDGVQWGLGVRQTVKSGFC